MLAALFLLACNGASDTANDGASGSDGTIGTQGEQGPVGPAGAPGVNGFHWEDANGVQVTDAESLVHWDARGRFWVVEPETATVVIPYNGEYYFYEGDTCSGEAWITAPPEPGRPALFFDGAFRTRTNAQAVEEVCASSYSLPGEPCYTTDGCVVAIRLAEMDEDATLTEPSWAPPLHRERFLSE